jgi:hypothetical protein
MSEKTELTTQQVEKVGGGDCTAEQAVELSRNLTEAYENLIQFTTYMMERISN